MFQLDLKTIFLFNIYCQSMSVFQFVLEVHAHSLVINNHFFFKYVVISTIFTETSAKLSTSSYPHVNWILPTHHNKPLNNVSIIVLLNCLLTC